MQENTTNQNSPIFIISGGKGVAGHTIVHSLLIQYPDNNIPIHVFPNIQSHEKIIEAVKKVKEAGGILTHTMVNSKLRNILISACEEMNVNHIDFMGPLAKYLESDLGLKSVSVPGLYRRINAQYFERIEAIEYTMNHDDGMNPQKLKNAEIILTGLSRSGKTPLSIYMSMFGWKVANVPLVKGIDPPKELFEVDSKRIFALSINLSQLILQRRKRLVQMKNIENTSYINPVDVKDEIRFANLVFERGNFTRINVTNKPIETSANEVIGLISDRFGQQHQQLKSNNEH